MKKIIFILALAFISFTSQAAIYKCTNKYGKMVFQDKPCKAVELNIRTEEDLKKLIDSKSRARKEAAKQSSS